MQVQEGPEGSIRVHEVPRWSMRVEEGSKLSMGFNEGPLESVRDHDGPCGSTRVQEGQEVPGGSERVQGSWRVEKDPRGSRQSTRVHTRLMVQSGPNNVC